MIVSHDQQTAAPGVRGSGTTIAEDKIVLRRAGPGRDPVPRAPPEDLRRRVVVPGGRSMNRWRIAHAWVVVFLSVGCDLTAPPPATTGPTPTSGGSRAQVEGPAPAPRAESGARISGDTERDLHFAEFVRDTAGSMVQDVSV